METDLDLLNDLYSKIAAAGIPETDPLLRVRRETLDSGLYLVEVSYDHVTLIYELAQTPDAALLTATMEVAGGALSDVT